MGSEIGTARFANRFDAPKFAFMAPDKIRDANKRRPSDPDYDPSTLHIPLEWFKANKISDGQRQWWEFKAKYWDAVLLFKMGKCALGSTLPDCAVCPAQRSANVSGQVNHLAKLLSIGR